MKKDMNDYKTIDKQQWTCLNKEGDAGSGLIYINPEEPDVILKTSRRASKGRIRFGNIHAQLTCYSRNTESKTQNILNAH